MGRLKIIIIILILFSFVITINSCNKINKDKRLSDKIYFEDIENYSSVISTDEISNFHGIVEDYKKYYDSFFRIWLGEIEKIKPLLDKFNSEKVYDNKIEYAGKLEEHYTVLLGSIKDLDPPAVAKRSHKLAIVSIEKRIEYFHCILENNLYNVDEIENEAYIYETMFWHEIDNIFIEFEERATELGLGGDLDSVYLISG